MVLFALYAAVLFSFACIDCLVFNFDFNGRYLVMFTLPSSLNSHQALTTAQITTRINECRRQFVNFKDKKDRSEYLYQTISLVKELLVQVREHECHRAVQISLLIMQDCLQIKDQSQIDAQAQIIDAISHALRLTQSTSKQAMLLNLFLDQADHLILRLQLQQQSAVVEKVKLHVHCLWQCYGRAVFTLH